MHVPARVIRPLHQARTVYLASAPLPTTLGTFETHVFRCVANHDTGDAVEKEHVALVYGDVEGAHDLPVRVHSECLTSEVFGSLRCDCKAQLDHAMAEIVRAGAGAVLYLRQEGRGIGLANKIRAYELQAHGADTVDANRMLGLPDDARRYDVVAGMLDFLGVESIRLMTNNPLKVDSLRAEQSRRRGLHAAAFPWPYRCTRSLQSTWTPSAVGWRTSRATPNSPGSGGTVVALSASSALGDHPDWLTARPLRGIRRCKLCESCGRVASRGCTSELRWCSGGPFPACTRVLLPT